MKILITGAKGFVGRNLVAQLRNIQSGKAKNYGLSPELEIFEYDIGQFRLRIDPARLAETPRQHLPGDDFVVDTGSLGQPLRAKQKSRRGPDV